MSLIARRSSSASSQIPPVLINNQTQFDTENIHSNTAIIIYDALGIFGTVLLAAILSTAWLSTRIQRSPTWFFLMTAGIFCSASGLLIIGQQGDAEPNRALCSAQGMLVYAATLIVPSSALAFVLQIYLSTTVFLRRSQALSTRSTYLIYLIPLVPSCATLVASIVIGARDPLLLQRDPTGMRCHLLPSQIFYWTISASGVATFITVILNVLIAINLRRAWKASDSQISESSTSVYRLPTTNTLIRLFIFTFAGVIVLLVAFIPWGIFHQRTVISQMIYNYTLTLIPIGLSVIIGMQKDILRVWMFWRS